MATSNAVHRPFTHARETGLAQAWTLLWLGGMACLTLHAVAGREQDRWQLLRHESLSRQLDAALAEGGARCWAAWQREQARAQAAGSAAGSAVGPAAGSAGAAPSTWEGGEAQLPTPAGAVRWQCAWPAAIGAGALQVQVSTTAGSAWSIGQARSRLFWVEPVASQTEERRDAPAQPV